MKSIGLKLWAGMMAMVMVVLLLLWFFQIVFLEDFYYRIRIADIKKEGTALAQVLAAGDTAGFKDRLDAFAFHNNLSIDLLDTGGNSIYLTGSATASGHMPMMQNKARLEALREVLTGQEITIPLTHPRFGNRFMLIGLPVQDSGQLMGVLLINMPLAPVEDTALILKKQLVLIILILLLVATVISLLIAKTFTMPILEIKKVSEQMATGDYTHRISPGTRDEIGQLADTINYMGQRLAQVEQLRKDLIANVSHELRTPLSLIRGYAETIRDVSGNSPAKRERQLGIIIEETERLGKIVDDILNLSQLQAGYFKLEPTPFAVMKTLNAAVNRYEMLGHKIGVKVVLLGVSEGLVEADEARIEQVLYNLINNAVNHTPKGGTVTVKAIDAAETMRIEVADTGSGIPEKDLPHIWQRYYKAKKADGKRTIGTGLGLAIVKEVLDAHQIAYGVVSLRGVGTTFWLELKKISF